MVNETSRYATEIVAFLARRGDRPIYTEDLMAELPHVPARYGMKIVTELRRRGVLLAKKGRGAGCGVRINPRALNRSVWEVISYFEAPPMERDSFTSRFGAYYVANMDRIKRELTGMVISSL